MILDLGVEKLEWGPAELFTIDAELGCAANTAPTILIVAPLNGATIYPQSVTEPPERFSVQAIDPEDGELAVSWSSSLDGDLGTTVPGGGLDVTSLSLGEHTITATTADSEGLVASASVTFTAAAGNPTINLSTKNSSGQWVPVTSITGVKGSQVVVRVGVASHLNLGISNCLSVTWNSPLPVAADGACSVDYTITLATQGTFTVSASVTDADGLSGSAFLAVAVSAPPAVAQPQFSAVTGRRGTNPPQVCDGCTLDEGETLFLRIDYLNFSSASVAVHYDWTISKGSAAPMPLPGSDSSPNSYSLRNWTPSASEGDGPVVFIVQVKNASGTVLETRSFSVVYAGNIG